MSLSRLKAVAQLLALLVMVLGLPAVACHSRWLAHKLRLHDVPPSRIFLGSGGMVDAATGRRLMKRDQPAWVLLGNSMLNSRVDPDFLQQLSGKSLMKMGAAGSKSPVWFLLLKQVILGAEVKPRCVTVFFRERDLTWPENEMARNEGMVERLNGREEPEWPLVMASYDAAVHSSFAGGVKAVTTAFQSLLTGDKLRAWGRGKMQKLAFLLTNGWQPAPDDARRAQMNDRLSLDHQRQTTRPREEAVRRTPAEEHQERTTEPTEFDPAPHESFLPHMVALAAERGVQLHFHRVRYRFYKPEEDRDKAYIAALKSYLKQHGAVLTDESTDPAIKPEMYVDDYHINTAGHYQQPYMRAFWARVQPVVEAALATP
jgi:hypothetical protein